MRRLSDLVGARRGELLERWRREAGAGAEVSSAIPAFVDEVLALLQRESGSGTVVPPALIEPASAHGGETYRRGFDVARAVSDYKLIADGILRLAEETQTPVTIREAKIILRCVAAA